MDYFHAPPATTGSRLDNNRVSDLSSDRLGLFDIFYRIFSARQNRDASLGNGLTSRDLIAHQTHILRAGADKGDTAITADLSKFGIFG